MHCNICTYICQHWLYLYSSHSLHHFCAIPLPYTSNMHNLIFWIICSSRMNHPSISSSNTGNVNVIPNPGGGSEVGRHLQHRSSVGGVLPPTVVPVQDPNLPHSGGGGTNLKLIVEAPPVTELVSETPMDNGVVASSGLNVIGGEWLAIYDYYPFSLGSLESHSIFFFLPFPRQS